MMIQFDKHTILNANNIVSICTGMSGDIPGKWCILVLDTNGVKHKRTADSEEDVLAIASAIAQCIHDTHHVRHMLMMQPPSPEKGKIVPVRANGISLVK